MIFGWIENAGGFSKMNRTVKTALREWILKAGLRELKQLEAEEDGGGRRCARFAMRLAGSLVDTYRLNEADALYCKALTSYNRLVDATGIAVAKGSVGASVGASVGVREDAGGDGDGGGRREEGGGPRGDREEGHGGRRVEVPRATLLGCRPRPGPPAGRGAVLVLAPLTTSVPASFNFCGSS